MQSPAPILSIVFQIPKKNKPITLYRGQFSFILPCNACYLLVAIQFLSVYMLRVNSTFSSMPSYKWYNLREFYLTLYYKQVYNNSALGWLM